MKAALPTDHRVVVTGSHITEPGLETDIAPPLDSPSLCPSKKQHRAVRFLEKKINASKDEGKLKLSHVTSGCVAWCSHCGKV